MKKIRFKAIIYGPGCFLFCYMNDFDHQMSKKVDEQEQYLIWIFEKWTSSCLFKGQNKIGVKIPLI